MLGEILEINNNHLIIKKNENILNDIINLYVKITDSEKNYVGEITSVTKEFIEVKVIGELKDNSFSYGISTKPAFNSKVELLDDESIKILFGVQNYQPNKNLYLGKSALYKDIPIYANINSLFANHLVVLGNTGSGKSCGMARILQNLFYKKDIEAKNATFFIIDAYGEYKNAFSLINAVNKDLCFKSYTSDFREHDEKIEIPLWLLSLDDICLLLNITNKNQIPIVEKTMKLVDVFMRDEKEVIETKNSIIAKAILDIFISGNTPAQIRDQIFSVLTRYNTSTLNLDTEVYQPGYTRPLKQCLKIDENGKIREMELVTKFLQEFVLDEVKLNMPDGTYVYTLKDLLYAFDFALIDEGLLSDDNIYSKTHELRVHLSSLIDSPENKFFLFDKYFTKEEFLSKLTHKNDKKCQVINSNLNNLDDRFAKVIAKIYAKFLFDINKNSDKRGNSPIHIVLEEAHRYVQNDTDVKILGYNIFERIAKEGRKYAILLDLISQRPSELSETVLSQCANFIVFKITHPKDIEYIKAIIPYVDEETLEKIKNLPVGHAFVFGSSVSLPSIIKVDMATPAPESESADISTTWF